jgi:hypothetical protein
VAFSAGGDGGGKSPELLAQSAHAICGSHCGRRHNWRRTSRLENQNDKKKSLGGSKWFWEVSKSKEDGWMTPH